jgi:hypothetical protein
MGLAAVTLLALLAAQPGDVASGEPLPVRSAIMAAGPAEEPTSFAADSRKGRRTIAFAQGIVQDPAEISVRVSVAPTQRVVVGWTGVCVDGSKFRLGNGTLSVRGTQTQTLGVPIAGAAACSVAVAAGLEGTGSLRIDVLATRRAEREPSDIIEIDSCEPVTLPERNPSHAVLVAWWRKSVQAQVERYRRAGVPLPARYRYPGDRRARQAYGLGRALVPRAFNPYPGSPHPWKDRRLLSDVSRIAAVLNIVNGGYGGPDCEPTQEQASVSLRLFARGPGRAAVRGTVTATGPGLSVSDAKADSLELSLPVGATVTLTAIPAAGTIFAGWHAARCGWPYENTEVPGVHMQRQNPWTCTITAANPPVPGQGHGPFVIVADAFFCDPENTPPGLCESLPRAGPAGP